MTRKELVIAAAALLALAGLLLFVHYLVFKDAHTTLLYSSLDVAFVPIDILVFSLIVDRLLRKREVAARHHKLNMVIGAFFSEAGVPLLRLVSTRVLNRGRVCDGLCIDASWSDQQLRQAQRDLQTIELDLAVDAPGLEALRDSLVPHRAFILSLLENPMLLEHESFSDCLWAILHLQEELSAREGLDGLPGSDMNHLRADTQRACTALMVEWVRYMTHLRRDYPYLYSFAARTNPFRQDASVTVT